MRRSRRLPAAGEVTSLLMRAGALNITVVSVDGLMNLGFLGARDTLPHLQRLSAHLHSATSELIQITAEREGRRTRR